MSSKQIKGLTVEIGGDTSKLGKALESIEKKSKSLSGELGSINKLLKLDPTNTELLAQKQKVLAEAISNTEEKLGILREAEKQVQAQFEKGEVSAEQYRALQREVLAAEGQLKRYKAAAEDTARAVEDLGNNSDQASDKLDDMGAEAQKAANASDNLDSSAADAAKNGIAALIAAAGAAIAAIAALAESTREHRTEMGKLDTAYKTSGHSSQTATAAYKELQSVIGETDQAVEAAQQIALLASNTQQVAEWSELAAGVVGRFGDALQPETFYEAANEVLKLGESTSAWTQMLEQTGIMAVEDFNEGLAACTTAEEKQAYMLGVAKKALGAAAKQYKVTNAEVIRANKANEEWNATLAECGETVEPVITDVKKLGTALLKQAKAPLKDVATYIRGTFLPALTKVGSWAKQNIPAITAAVAGTTAALVAHKVATLVATAATEGATLATLAHAAAQKALNAVMAASPWGLAATAVVALGAALIAFNATASMTVEKIDTLTEEERKLMESADEAADAFRDQQRATEEAFSNISAEMGYVQDLAKELLGLADASGQVKEEDEARAQFILTELNEALGTEYAMVGGIIQQYDDLKGSVQDVIAAKTANALLEAANESYIAALQNETEAWNNVNLKLKDYEEQLQIVNAYQEMSTQNWAKYNEKLAESGRIGTEKYRQMAVGADMNLKKEREVLAAKEAELQKAQAAYGSYQETILNYQTAQEKALNGEYQTAIEIFGKKDALYTEHSELVGVETAKVLATLQKEAEDALIKAELTKENFEKGVAGYTEEMVDEAARGYREAIEKFENAYADAYAVGGDIGDGMIDGAESRRNSLFAKARSLVEGFLNSARAAADSHSPSRKAIKIFEDIGAGAEIGVENKTEDVANAGQRQAEALLDAYRSQDLAGQRTLQNVAVRQATQQVGSYMAAGSQNAGILNRILAAIEKGQVLMIDRDLLIGGTAGDYDTKFGQLRMLADRGAL